MSFEETLEHLSGDERFKATVHAMNTLLIHRGIFTREEFGDWFVAWASKQKRSSIKEIT
jgi:hypothetical protein